MKGVLFTLLLVQILRVVPVLGSNVQTYIPSNVEYVEHTQDRSARLYTADFACMVYSQKLLEQFDSQALGPRLYTEHYLNCIREFFPKCELDIVGLKLIEQHKLFTTPQVFFVNKFGWRIILDPSLPAPSKHLAEFARKNLPRFNQLYQANVWQVERHFIEVTQLSFSPDIYRESTEHFFRAIFWCVLAKIGSTTDALQYKKKANVLFNYFLPNISFHVISYPARACGVQIQKEFVFYPKNSPIVQGFETSWANHNLFLGPPVVYAYMTDYGAVIAKFEILGRIVVAHINQLNSIAIKKLTKADFVAAQGFNLNEEMRFFKAFVPELFNKTFKA